MENISQKNRLLKILINHFNTTGWLMELNENKLNNRSRISDGLTEVGGEIIEIERHRAILGDEYVKGSPMNAYETYWMRYSINPSTLQVKELSDKSGKCNIDVLGLVKKHLDSELFDLKIEATTENNFQISDSVAKQTKEISTYAEAEAFVLDFITPNVDYFLFRLDFYEFDEADKQKYLIKYEECLREELINKAKIAWEGREECWTKPLTRRRTPAPDCL